MLSKHTHPSGRDNLRSIQKNNLRVFFLNLNKSLTRKSKWVCIVQSILFYIFILRWVSSKINHFSTNQWIFVFLLDVYFHPKSSWFRLILFFCTDWMMLIMVVNIHPNIVPILGWCTHLNKNISINPTQKIIRFFRCDWMK